MAGRTLPAGYLEAGAEYLAALEKLGLSPDALLWAWDNTISEFTLVLVTPHVDHAGPLAVAEALIKAYNASATPQEIDPFMVRLHSNKQLIADALGKIPQIPREGGPWKAMVHDPDGRNKRDLLIQDISVDVMDITFSLDWVYILKERGLSPVDRSRAWKRFTHNIEKIAA